MQTSIKQTFQTCTKGYIKETWGFHFLSFFKNSKETLLLLFIIIKSKSIKTPIPEITNKIGKKIIFHGYA
jgi:hypothetical protein